MSSTHSRSRSPRILLRGVSMWIAAALASVIFLALLGITIEPATIIGSLGGPASWFLAITTKISVVWLAPVSLVVFVAFQRLRLAWLWCAIWVGFGVGFVWWAISITSITERIGPSKSRMIICLPVLSRNPHENSTINCEAGEPYGRQRYRVDVVHETTAANSRPASPFGVWRHFARASSSPPSLSAAVARFSRS